MKAAGFQFRLYMRIPTRQRVCAILAMSPLPTSHLSAGRAGTLISIMKGSVLKYSMMLAETLSRVIAKETAAPQATTMSAIAKPD